MVRKVRYYVINVSMRIQSCKISLVLVCINNALFNIKTASRLFSSLISFKSGSITRQVTSHQKYSSTCWVHFTWFLIWWSIWRLDLFQQLKEQELPVYKETIFKALNGWGYNFIKRRKLKYRKEKSGKNFSADKHLPRFFAS